MIATDDAEHEREHAARRRRRAPPRRAPLAVPPRRDRGEADAHHLGDRDDQPDPEHATSRPRPARGPTRVPDPERVDGREQRHQQRRRDRRQRDAPHRRAAADRGRARGSHLAGDRDGAMPSCASTEAAAGIASPAAASRRDRAAIGSRRSRPRVAAGHRRAAARSAIARSARAATDSGSPTTIGRPVSPPSQHARVERNLRRAAARPARRRAAAPPPEPKIGVGSPQCGHSNQLMFSTMPSTGTPTRWNIFAPRSASPTATSCGVVTMIAPCTVRRLHERELRVAGARRHVDEEVVELTPRDVAQELRDDLHDDRARARSPAGRARSGSRGS